VSPRPRPTPIDPALPQRAKEPSVLPDRKAGWGELDSLDLAVYVAVAATTTPTLPRARCAFSSKSLTSKIMFRSGGAYVPRLRR
jgi:hypothetical protein